MILLMLRMPIQSPGGGISSMSIVGQVKITST